MPTKIFTGSTMAACLAQVKRELGPDAVILRTRAEPVATTRMLGLAQREQFEITATNDPGRAAAAGAPSTSSARRVASRQDTAFQPTAFRTIRAPAATIPVTAVEMKPADERAVQDLRKDLEALEDLVRSLRQPLRAATTEHVRHGRLAARTLTDAMLASGLARLTATAVLTECGIGRDEPDVRPESVVDLVRALVARIVRVDSSVAPD